MQDRYIPRNIEGRLLALLNEFPVVAILGPRQCGKSTLARHCVRSREPYVFLDLESLSDRRKLADPEMYFQIHEGDLICLDEIQRMPI